MRALLAVLAALSLGEVFDRPAGPTDSSQPGIAANVVVSPQPAQPGRDTARDKSEAPRDPLERSRRVLFITSKDSPRCEEELSRLRKPGGDFEKLRARGWKIDATPVSHLQIIDRDAVPELVKELHVADFPSVACIEDGEIVRSFQDGCTTPLDMWTFGFLLKGVDERPPGSVPEEARAESTGHYPLRGNHWSVDGDWHPARETMVSHLRSANHARYLQASWEIETWSYEELRSLHDNLHEQYGGGVSASRAKSSSKSSQFSASRKINGR